MPLDIASDRKYIIKTNIYIKLCLISGVGTPYECLKGQGYRFAYMADMALNGARKCMQTITQMWRKMTTKLPWPASELRLTKSQAEYLTYGTSRCWSPKLANLTEDSLGRRKMISWHVTPSGHGALRANAKGRAALEKYYGPKFLAANDNKRVNTDAA